MDKTPQRNIKHVLAVASGKGGVGKSTVTGMAAIALSKQGYKVGILDADVTGPSIPKLFGLCGYPERDGDLLQPMETELGIKVMSLNLLLLNADDPVIWRGPIIGKVVMQFWDEVAWGDLDYLLVDLPPGTGDVPLTVMKSMPVEGVIMVTSPQDLAGMVVGKAINMAKALEIPVLGLVENMSYLLCPDCGKKIELFGKSGAAKLAAKFKLKLLGRLPLDPELVSLADQGYLEKYPAGQVFDSIPNLVQTQAVRSAINDTGE